MINKVLIAFAMKQEFAPWRRRHRFFTVENLACPVLLTRIGLTEVYVTLAGAGATNASRINELASDIGPSLAIVTGVAAGLKPDWRPGDILVAESVSGLDRKVEITADPALVRLALECGARPAPTLITLPRIVRTVEEKMGLAVRADAADMDSLPLMRQWVAQGIPSLALRVILDPVEMPMVCDFESAMDGEGQVRITSILAQLARHPRLLSDFLQLARQSRYVLHILAHYLDGFLEQLDSQAAGLGTGGSAHGTRGAGQG
jgi:hypothetical protein